MPSFARKPPSYAPPVPASIAQTIRSVFAALPTPETAKFLGLHSLRGGRGLNSFELRNSLTGERFPLGYFAAADYQSVTRTALAVIEEERKNLVQKPNVYRASA